MGREKFRKKKRNFKRRREAALLHERRGNAGRQHG
jgi:hypothetical protein